MGGRAASGLAGWFPQIQRVVRNSYTTILELDDQTIADAFNMCSVSWELWCLFRGAFRKGPGDLPQNSGLAVATVLYSPLRNPISPNPASPVDKDHPVACRSRSAADRPIKHPLKNAWTAWRGRLDNVEDEDLWEWQGGCNYYRSHMKSRTMFKMAGHCNYCLQWTYSIHPQVQNDVPRPVGC